MNIITKRKQQRFIGYCLIMLLISALILSISACSSKPSILALSSLAVKPDSPANLTVGSTQQLTANGTYSNGSSEDATSQATWDSSNITVATVSSTGLVTGVAAGTTNITAALDGETSSNVILTVVEPTLSSIVIVPPEYLTVGATQQLVVSGTFSDGSTADVTSQVTWASSNTGIATISSTGLATAGAPGTTNITAVLAGVTSPAVTLTVVEPAPSAITVKPVSPANLLEGSTQQFTAIATYPDGTTANISSKVTWTSSNNANATISWAGLATGIAAGTTSITAALSGVTSPAATLTVIAPTLSSIAIKPATPGSLTVSLTQQFTATGSYSDGSTADITSQVKWASSNTNIATISSTGLATGVMVGTTNITANLSGVSSSAATLTVTPIPANPASQSISFTVSPAMATIIMPFMVGGASASSGLSVTYTIKSGPATISGTTIMPTGLGNVVVEASQAGNVDYSAAVPVDQTITIVKANQTISFTVNPSVIETDTPFTVSGASASSGLPVTYTIKSGPATISGTTITTTGLGKIVVEASQPGNADYNAATPVDQTIVSHSGH